MVATSGNATSSLQHQQYPPRQKPSTRTICNPHPQYSQTNFSQKETFQIFRECFLISDRTIPGGLVDVPFTEHSATTLSVGPFKVRGKVSSCNTATPQQRAKAKCPHILPMLPRSLSDSPPSSQGSRDPGSASLDRICSTRVSWLDVLLNVSGIVITHSPRR